MSGELKYDDKIALVIDDQEPVREMVRSMLRSLGFMEIRVASNALDAIELMSKGRSIDLIICDYSMPYLSGLDFVGAVRTDQANARKDTPIIILTGYAEDDKVQTAAWLQVQAFIRKPVSLDHLAKRIGHAMENPPGEVGHIIDPERVKAKLLQAEIERMQFDASPNELMDQAKLDELFLTLKKEAEGDMNAAMERLVVPVDDVRTGDVVVSDIKLGTGEIIVPKGAIVTEKIIKTLRRMEERNMLAGMAVVPRKKAVPAA